MAAEASRGEPRLYLDRSIRVKRCVGDRRANPVRARRIGVTELALIVGASRPLVPVIAAVPDIGTARPVSRRVAVAGCAAQPGGIPGRRWDDGATVGHRVQNRLTITPREVVAERASGDAVAGDVRACLGSGIEAWKRAAR